MAEEKKDDKKSGDKKAAGSASPFPVSLGTLLAIIALIVFFTYRLSGRSFFGDDTNSPPTFEDVAENFGGPKHLTAGDSIVNVEEVIVRRNLTDAAPLGTQQAGVKGNLVEGPETAFGRDWWFVDYKEAPDGWVESDQITDRTFVATAKNSPSLAVNFFRPIFVLLCFLLAGAIVWVWWKKKESESIVEKKKEEAKNSYFAKRGIIRETVVVESMGGEPEGSIDGLPQNLPSGSLPDGWLNQSAPVVTNRPVEPDRWRHVKVLITSTSQNDWRQAIIEADIILEEMLRAIGYDGTTIGDMLKNVEPSDFATLDKAWDAHKVRNQIAHRGSDFVITRQDAQSVIEKYEDVFREFNYI